MIPCFVQLPSTTGIKIVNINYIMELQASKGHTLVCFPDKKHLDDVGNARSYLKVDLPMQDVERLINNSIVETMESWADAQARAYARHNS